MLLLFALIEALHLISSELNEQTDDRFKITEPGEEGHAGAGGYGNMEFYDYKKNKNKTIMGYRHDMIPKLNDDLVNFMSCTLIP